MNIGYSNKTQHILFYEKRKMRIVVYNLQKTCLKICTISQSKYEN
jgi:hypothetical protein